MRIRLWVSLSIAVLASVLLIAAGLAQTTSSGAVTHHSAPITLQVTAPGASQPVTVTVVLDIETSLGNSSSEPAIKVKITPKRSMVSEGASVSGITVGDIESANFVATPTAVPSAGRFLPTPTPAPVITTTVAAGSKVNDAANLRGGPGTTFPIVGQAPAGDNVTIVGRSQAGDWLQLEGGAWIAAFLIDEAPADMPVVETPAP